MTTTTQDHNHQITLDTGRLEAIHQRIENPPTILCNTAGRATCSIFKAPQSFKDFDPKLYHPQIISIGPFHHGAAQLRMMEEHKYQYLGQLLARTGLHLSTLFEALIPLECPARQRYSEAIGLGPHDHLEMLVVDGCFIIELFRKMTKRVEFKADDPIFARSWILPSLLRDLHRLENQIPFSVLQRLFDVTYMEKFDGENAEDRKDKPKPTFTMLCLDNLNCTEKFDGENAEGRKEKPKPTLAMLCLQSFNNTIQRPSEILWKYKDQQPQHLLDLIRSSFITPELAPRDDQRRRSTSSHVILPVSQLRQAGIHLKQGKSETFLDVKFRSSGIIEMPKVTLDDFMSSLLVNCVAYEQCREDALPYFTTYLTLADCLINTAKDVEYLCDKNIIENYLGDEAEIVKLINNFGKDVAFDINECYLAQLFDDVNVYYKNDWHVRWASLKYTYFNTPWSFISAVAAFVLLVLTILQTLYTVMPYYTQK